MKRQMVYVVLMLCGLAAGQAFAQEKKADAAPPTVTELQQAQFDRAALLKDNKLKDAQLAGIAYQQASEAFEKLVASLQKPGFDLQLTKDGKLEYVTHAEPPKKDEAPAPSAPKKDSPPK